jgi:excisionase family DNA binding protein
MTPVSASRGSATKGHQVVSTSQLIETLQELVPTVGGLAPAECPRVIGMLEQLKAHAWARMVEQRMDPAENGDLLDMAQVAKKLNIPKCRAYELARQGKIPIVRIGKYIRMSPADLSEYENRGKPGIR